MDPLLLNLILLAPLFLGLLLSQFLRFNLKQLQGVYLLLVSVNVLICYFLLAGQWLSPIIIGLVGLLAVVLATGFIGKRMTPSDYALMQAGVGLFPWTLWGFTASIVYGIVLVLFAVLIALRPKFKNPFKRNLR